MRAATDLSDEKINDWREFQDLTDPAVLNPYLRAALVALEESGYSALTVRDIARRAGVTNPALYYHYSSKQALLAALLLGSLENMRKRCSLALCSAGQDPVHRLLAICEALVLNMAYRRHIALLAHDARNLAPDDERKYRSLYVEIYSMVQTVVDQGISTGQFAAGQPAGTTRAILGLCHSVADWYRPGGLLTPQEVATRYAYFALGIVNAPEPGHSFSP